MSTKQIGFLGSVAILVTAIAGAVWATPASGVLSATVVARGVFQDSVNIKFKTKHGSQEVLHVPDAQETVMQQIVIGPGGQTGWHSHPGPAVVLVRAGTLTFYSGDDPGCFARSYSAGQAFIDSGQGHVHLARNWSDSENAEVWVTYFDVPPGGAFRLDAPDPGNCLY
jgi:quercetin dioxygenase-like cupin family protein